jgi:hypothetical protein
MDLHRPMGKESAPQLFWFLPSQMMLIPGENTIWAGAFLASAHVLNSVPSVYPSWFGYIMIISPLFTNLILTKVNLAHYS